MFCLCDTRWKGPHGIGRFAKEVISRLPDAHSLESSFSPTSPIDSLWTSLQIAWLRPAVYFSPGFNPPLFSQVPYVFTIHDLIHLNFPEETSILKKIYYNSVVKFAAKRAFKVLTVTHFSKKEISEWSNLSAENIVVVGNGVGDEFKPQGEKNSPGYPYLLYVGNRKPHKNLSRLFQSFAISGLAGEVRLVVSGDPDERIISQVRKFNIEKDVFFSGVISDNSLPAFYRGAIALVLPSLYEGFGLPVVEAMACGTPVLTSNITALPEIANGAALCVDPYDIDELSSGLRRIVYDSQLRDELTLKGFLRAGSFTWDNVASLTFQTLKSAIE